MTWFKVDDTFAFHSKTVEAGNAAIGLWTRAGAWSSQQLTDGKIPTSIARQLGSKREADRLVDVGLWFAEPDGYRFWQWAERNPIQADVKAAREAEGHGGTYGNHRRWHTSRGVNNPNCRFCKEAAS
jgi:hypothetical protein